MQYFIILLIAVGFFFVFFGGGLGRSVTPDTLVDIWKHSGLLLQRDNTGI